MKDIDFDELDRAVSSVLGQSAVKDEPKEQAAVVNDDTETSATETAVVDSVQSDQTEAPTAAPQPATRSTPAPSLAIKRRGRFMDVMHPSAGMGQVSQAPAPKPVRPLAPLTSSITEQEPAKEEASSSEQSTGIEANAHEPTATLDETTVPVGAEPTPIEGLLPEHVQSSDSAQPEKTEESSSEISETTPSSDSMYVDPLSAAEKKPDTFEDESDIDSAEDVGEDDGVVESFPSQTEEAPTEPATQPSSTPFLSDTNVDKRPLGAFVGSEQSSETVDTTSAAPMQHAMAMPGDSQSAPSVPLPRELQPDVVEVESVQEPETTATAKAGNDGRVEGHPLFDTSTYHEPIAAVHGHGMAAWMKWMIGLLICLVVGAGVGYFLFAAGL